VFGLAACAVSNPPKSVADSTAATQQFATAKQLASEGNWPEVIRTLRAIIEEKSFRRLSSDFQHRVLAAAGAAALYHGPLKLAYEYYVRATSMPEADYSDWLGRLRAAHELGSKADWIDAMTVLLQRWPDRSGQFNPSYVANAISEAEGLQHGAALPLLQALYAAHWRLKWDIEPSQTWRDLTLLLLENDRLPEAIDVSSHVTDIYVLINMRADRRFDVVTSANPTQFDIGAAVDRELREFQLASEKAPTSLALKSQVIDTLVSRQYYGAALAAADAVLLDIQSTNYPEKIYEDYAEVGSWFFNLRAIALMRLGRWGEAATQLEAASRLYENHEGNVSQVINLGDLYNEMARPNDAIAAIGRLTARTSPYGAMQLEAVRLEAAYQLEDSKQVERSLKYMRANRRDAPLTYQFALIVANKLDSAAHELIAELLDEELRQGALMSVQDYASTQDMPRDTELGARQRAVIARKDVQAAIRRVGRAESYRVEEKWQ
jgi:hypothetical protein